MTRAMLLVLGLALLLALTPVLQSHEAACAHPTGGLCVPGFPDDARDAGDAAEAFNPAATPGKPGKPPAKDPRQGSFELLGTYNPGTGSLADVWAHKRVAYMGSWLEDCQSQGVRAISLRDPRNPTLLSTFGDAAGNPNLAGTWTEKVIVQRVNTPSFRGDLAAVSFQPCSTSTGSFAGFGVYDVTDPANPKELALVPTRSPFGVHELWLESRPGGAYVYTAANFAEFFSLNIAGDTEEFDFQVWDVSNPTEPDRIAQWGASQEIGVGPRDGFGNDFPFNFVHSVIGDGRYAYLSHWDLGTVILDMRDPANPTYVGDTRDGYNEDAEGNAHSAALLPGGQILIQTDEDFEPEGDETTEQAWGYPRFFNLNKNGDGTITPEPIGTFELPTTRQFPPPGPGDYTVHDPKVRGNTIFFSWYAEGIVAVDASRLRGNNPGDVRKVAQWIVPGENPNVTQQQIIAPGAAVWGVALEGDLVLASDMNSGLYVLRLKR